ncbi:hypothetical protein HPG69_005555 [Diceros bicornis minor]|uniref:Olduvai domain-containing protein n=1 Tax=Diceros bicornis minor TaxID=77932 RepID=A0A7J7ELT1_DICBM|nr:hypothetical protein HPG69_005555 [Diceros bicornis minor]
MELQEVEKKEVLQDSEDECVLTPSILQEEPECYQHCSDDKFALDEQEVSSALDVACKCSHSNGTEDALMMTSHIREICPMAQENQLENQKDREGLKGQGPIACSPPYPTSLSRELLTIKDNDVPQDTLDECYFTCSIGHDLSSSYRPYRSSSLAFDGREVFSALDVVVPTQEAYHLGPLSFQRPEVKESQAQLQPSTQVASDLPLQLDQFDCSDSKARLGLSSTIWSFEANYDSGDQWPLFQELGWDGSLRMKNASKLEGDAFEGWASSNPGYQVTAYINALSALKQKIIQRKLLFSKWRLTCSFPGLQLRILRTLELREDIADLKETIT